MEKTEGCDHMKCRCTKEFCYICGGNYGNCYCNSNNNELEEDEEENNRL